MLTAGLLIVTAPVLGCAAPEDVVCNPSGGELGAKTGAREGGNCTAED